MCESATSRTNANTNGVRSKGPGGPAPSALRRMAPSILLGYAFNTILYLFVLHAVLPSDLSPKSEYCPGGAPGCVRRDLFAFQAVSFLNLAFLGLTGVRCFYFSRRASRAVPPTPQGRYFGGGLPEADLINAAIVVFQGWDFLTSLFFEEHCTAIMMTHHVLAFICGFFCLYYDVSHYYAVYFGGVSEFSSIFLCVVQLFGYYPASSLAMPGSSLSSSLDVVLAVCQAAFVLTFFVFRIVGWWHKSYMLISDGVYIIRNGLLERRAPGSGWFLWYLMSMSVLLGALQVYWFAEIVRRVSDILNG